MHSGRNLLPCIHAGPSPPRASKVSTNNGQLQRHAAARTLRGAFARPHLRRLLAQHRVPRVVKLQEPDAHTSPCMSPSMSQRHVPNVSRTA